MKAPHTGRQALVALHGRLRGARRAVDRVAQDGGWVAIAPSAHERIAASRRAIEKIIEGDDPVYGVNTGFGKLSEVHIAREDLAQLQLNLVRSHACGIGAPLSPPRGRDGGKRPCRAGAADGCQRNADHDTRRRAVRASKPRTAALVASACHFEKIEEPTMTKPSITAGGEVT